jgi:DNA-binding GntR family transcriptional regulator
MLPSERASLFADPTDAVGETVADGIYRVLIEAILFGDLASAQRLILQELAERFQVSLTPVREALQRLASEGFIETTPRRGYRIRKPSPRHVTELWQVRIGLELTAGDLTMACLKNGGATGLVERLERIQVELDQTETLSHRRHIELNAFFHQSMIEASGNRLLSGVYHGIQMQLLGAWVQRGKENWRLRLQSESIEHRSLIAALQERDGSALANAIKHHLGRSLDGALADLAEHAGEDIATNEKPSNHQGKEHRHEQG